jgi:phosphatidylserine/phosphatidylglycerophosphate/cardiolipin synthase-like enzyme
MLRNLLCKFKTRNIDRPTSRLFDQDTFYKAFIADLHCCQSEVVIESPFLTIRRVSTLLPVLQRLRQRGVNITINTKPLEEQDDFFYAEGVAAINRLQSIGVQILFTGGHHRKLAVLDRNIVYEGSLNILSQGESCEIMRRMQSDDLAFEVLSFTRLLRYL